MIVCAGCGHENAQGARFCNSCGQSLATASESREERKTVTVVFADLVGSTARAESLDPEDVRSLLSTYHARVRHELEAHGGTVEKFIGDAVVAVFGAPLAHEDDPERAVRAALAIQDAIAELNEVQPELELEVRIGVNTGEALVALEARPEAGEGMVSGDVINTAARLQSAAPPGGILVGEQTYRLTDRAIDYAEHDPVSAKGKAEPVPTWLAVARHSSFGVEHGDVGSAQLVGREREVALLADALARVRSNERPQLITLVGVPGIGKSRLVQELWHVVDADPDLITWRRGRSLPYGAGVPFWALGEIVKAHAGILESDAGEAAAAKLSGTVAALLSDRAEAMWVEQQLRPLVGLPVAERQPSRDEAFAAWRRFLEALAEARPAVVVFEDLHWADDDLLDFVDELTAVLDDVPLLLVCTARPDLLTRRPDWGGGKLNALTLSLSPLSDDETARLLHALIDRSVLPAETQARIVQRAEGVPLFAEEYARMLASGDAANELPESLHGLVAARVDGLPAQDKGLLQDAAVLGKVFWTDALHVLSGVEASVLDERLRALQRQEFVRRERRSAVEGVRQYVFMHALVRDVAYGQIPRAQRSEKHRRAAAWISRLPADRAEDRAEMLAHHLEAAISYGEAAGIAVDDLRPLAVVALRDAGDRAWALSLVSRAAQLYGRALEASDAGERDPELLFLCGQAQLWSDGGTGALGEAIDALLAAGNRELAAMAMVLLERGRWRAGDPDTTLLDRSLELVAGGGPSPTRGRVLAAVAVRRSIAGDQRDTLELATEAVEIARANRDLTAEAEALNSLGVVQSNGGDTRSALETTRRALALSLEGGGGDTPRCYVNVSTFEFDCGLLEEAAAHQREGLALSSRVGAAFTAEWLEAEIVLLDVHRGMWDASVDESFSELRARQEQGEFRYMDTQLRMAELEVSLSRAGRLDVEALEATLESVRAVGDPQLLLPVSGAGALLLAAEGLLEEARAMLHEYHDAARSTMLPSGPWDVSAALAWRLVYGTQAPIELHARNVMPWAEAAELVCLGDHVAAAGILACIGARAVEAQVRLEAARSLADSDPAEASRQLELACGFWRGVQATARVAYADELRARLRFAAS